MLYEFNEMDVYRFADTIAGKKDSVAMNWNLSCVHSAKARKTSIHFRLA